jgi:SAM-dependent methyltransferase
VATGEVTLPAVPGLLPEYVAMCDALFTALGCTFTPEELDGLRAVLREQLEQAYAASPRSTIVLTYEAPVGTALTYRVKAVWWTLQGAYANWLSTREPPLFGSEPDARVIALSDEWNSPATCPVLDVGGGTGRNGLALARRGHPVDVVEITEEFAAALCADAEREALPVRVLRRDVFTTTDDLRRDYRLIVVSEVVSDFRDAAQLRAVFALAADCLAEGGRLVFNAFLVRPGYVVDDAARELGQQCYSAIFTTDELRTAAAGLPLHLIADDSVLDYERARLASWPPTSWYEQWAGGQDVFDLPRERCPVELRWLVYERSDSGLDPDGPR